MNRLAILLILCTHLIVAAQTGIQLNLENRYLNLPVSFDEEDQVKLELVIDNDAVRRFDIFLPEADPAFWVFLDISGFKGAQAILRTAYGEEKAGLDLVYQSDDRPYLKNVYREKFRPQLHFSTMRGWINDPNGLVFYDGEYHLFYQHNPYGYRWGNMHWGHAVSTDLLHWTQLPEALYPDETGVCFSGSTVIDKNNTAGFKSGDEDVMVAVYTSTFFPTEAEEEAGMSVMERQSLAYSNDRGRNWTKYQGNPVIGDRQELLNSWNHRDPNVFWHEQTKKWVMILFEKIGLSIFTSDDLKEWQHESYFETFWECPELLQLPVDDDRSNTRWVVYSAGGDYVIGSFDGKSFTVENGPYNYVNGEFFAAQCYENIPQRDGRCIQIGWCPIAGEGMPFNGMMSFPTELKLRTSHDGVRLFNEPIAEIEQLHGKVYQFTHLSLKQANERLQGITPDLLHIKFVADNVNIMNYGLKIGSDRIGYSIRTNAFNYNDEQMVFKYLPELASNKIRYEIIVDKTSIEVFIDKGRFTMVLPRNLEMQEKDLLFWSDNGTSLNIDSLEIYEMRSIWQ